MARSNKRHGKKVIESNQPDATNRERHLELDVLIERDAWRPQSHQTSIHRKANAVSALPGVAQYSYRDGNDHSVFSTLPEMQQRICD